MQNPPGGMSVEAVAAFAESSVQALRQTFGAAMPATSSPLPGRRFGGFPFPFPRWVRFLPGLVLVMHEAFSTPFQEMDWSHNG